MYCQNRMVHTVQEGDSLYRLARQYHTTVTELILGNPGVHLYRRVSLPQSRSCPDRCSDSQRVSASTDYGEKGDFQCFQGY